ncbi:MAG: glutathione S-transferase family protein [Pseudomonadota bacterium]
MIKVYGRLSSSNVQRVLWLASELGLEVERETVGGTFGGNDAPDYRAMNPTGRVPTLQDGETTIWESDAILRYLAATYGAGGPFWPETPAERATADSWLVWQAINLGPRMDAVFFRTVRKPRAEHDPDELAPHVARLAEPYRFIDAGLSRAPFLSGDVFGLADIPAAIWTYRYLNLAIERPDLPNLAAWFERVSARPVFPKLVAQPFGSCLEEWLEHERAVA